MLEQRIGPSARPSRILLYGAGFLAALVGFYFELPRDLAVVAMAVLGISALAECFMPYIIHRRIYGRNPVLFEERTVTFADDGIRSEKLSGTIEAKWGSFERFKETKNLFLTYQSKDVVGIVPKRAFPNIEAISEFRNLLTSKIRG